MLLHVSVEADDPRRLATVVAELWGGEAFPYPMATDEGWMAIAGDDRGSMLEVLPRGTELRVGAGDNEAIGVTGPPRRHGGTHIALETILPDAAVLAIGMREGWAMKRGRRAGGAFFVIEAWVEGCLMLELVTPAMQPAYRATLTIANCRKMLSATG
jgi:hypothetical protein